VSTEQSGRRLTRRTALTVGAAASLAVAGGLTAPSAAAIVPVGGARVKQPAPAGRGQRPTVVLVHGAFADASGSAAVTTLPQPLGYAVLAPANPCVPRYSRPER